jgi:hypothetical protein
VCFLSLPSHTVLRAQSAPGFPCALCPKRGPMNLHHSGENLLRERAGVFRDRRPLDAVDAWGADC